MIKMNTIKKLYHGSACYFDAFDFCYARSFKDFGKGYDRIADSQYTQIADTLQKIRSW